MEVTTPELLAFLNTQTFLFQGISADLIVPHLTEGLTLQKLYPNRPIFMSHQQDESIDTLYIVYSGGPVIARSAPLDRVISLIYPGGSLGEQDLPFSYAPAWTAFPTLFEPYKSTTVLKIPLNLLLTLYKEIPVFKARYDDIFRLRCQFNYHLLNIGPYPPQAVAAFLRAVIYQERFLGFQPLFDPQTKREFYQFDLPSDLISRACQLNQRTVEQVLEGMRTQKLLAAEQEEEDLIVVINPEGLKEVYAATRQKLPWWPLRR